MGVIDAFSMLAPALGAYVEPTHPTAAAFRRAVTDGDAGGVRALFDRHPELAEVIDAPWFSFGGHALGEAAARGDRAMVDALIDLGADLDARSDWANGPYTALHRLVDGATPERLALADHIAARGATVDLHAAAGMGRANRILEILAEDPDRINEPGPDGATALHLARDAGIAALLLDHGADVDQRCVDHRSTPAMWAAGDRLDVVELLLARGATPDLFLAALVDDVDMASRILRTDPEAIDVRVRFGHSHPHVGHGDKYVWTLAGAQTPVELARRRGSDRVYRLLLEHSPPAVRMTQAALRDDLASLGDLLAEHPGLVAADPELAPAQNAALLGGAAAARYLLERGVDPNVRDDEAGATPLHHAAWRNLPGLARTLFEFGADTNLRDRSYDSTPLGWANEAGNVELLAWLVKVAPPDIVDSSWLGDVERVEMLLREDPERAHGLDDGRVSPLRSAAWCGHVDVVRILLAHGADPHHPHPQNGRTAVDYARAQGHVDILRLFDEQGRAP